MLGFKGQTTEVESLILITITILGGESINSKALHQVIFFFSPH
jgi:hypothetical protein